MFFLNQGAESRSEMNAEKDVTSGIGPVLVTRRRRGPCLCAILLLLALLAVAILLAALGFYYKAQMEADEIRDGQAYLRKLVKKVNDAPDATWKVPYRKFVSKKCQLLLEFRKAGTF